MVSRIKGLAVLSCAMLLIGPMMIYIASLSDANIPVRNDVLVVTFGNDETTHTATRIIENSVTLRNDALKPTSNIQVSLELPTRQIEREKATPKIRLGSLSVSLDNYENEMMNHKASVLVIVAHGAEEGIIDGDDCVSWSDVTESINKIDAVRTVLSCCYSDNLASSLTNGFGFSGIVDARMAAYLSSALVLSSFDGLSRLAMAHLGAGFDYGLRVASHEIDPMPLGEMPPWWNPWKLAFIVILTTVFYTWSPVTAPTTIAQCLILAAGVSGLAIVLTALTAVIYMIVGWIIPIAPADFRATLTTVQNLAGTVAGLIIGGIAAYLSGASYPGLLNFLRGLYALWVARAGVEAATAANPEPISRSLLAISAATLFVTAIETIINFGLTTPPPPPPPPSVVSQPVVPPSGGVGGSGGGRGTIPISMR